MFSHLHRPHYLRSEFCTETATINIPDPEEEPLRQRDEDDDHAVLNSESNISVTSQNIDDNGNPPIPSQCDPSSDQLNQHDRAPPSVRFAPDSYNSDPNRISIKEFTQSLTSSLGNKSIFDLDTECTNAYCQGTDQLFSNIDPNWGQFDDQISCPPLLRIKNALAIFHRIIQSKNGVNAKTPTASLSECNYGAQQLLNDFLHVLKVHCARKRIDQSTSKRVLCRHFQRLFPCRLPCESSQRHNRIKNTADEFTLFTPKLTNCKSRKQQEIINEKDNVFQQELDKVHSYFLHPLDVDEHIGPELHTPSRRRTDRSSMVFSGDWNGVLNLPASFDLPISPLLEVKMFSNTNRMTPRVAGSLEAPDAVVTTPLEVSNLFFNSTPRMLRVTSSKYVGQVEDVKWVKSGLGSKLKLLPALTGTEVSDEIKMEMYHRLQNEMGMFIWQSAQYVLYLNFR